MSYMKILFFRHCFLLTAAAIVLCIGAHAYAGEWDTHSDVRIGPGMKVIKAGDANIIVPEGGTAYRDSQGRIYQEPPDEYTTREFNETEKQIKAVEAEVTRLENRVKELEDKLEEATGRIRELERDKLKNEP